LSDETEREELRRHVAAVVHQTAGVDCHIALIPPKSLPFTSSGKLSRAGSKARYVSGEIQELPRPFAPGGVDASEIRLAHASK
jgi:fatty-acyl-CoA synthase